MHRARRLRCASAVLLALALSACGNEAPAGRVGAKDALKQFARESIDPAVEEKVRWKVLEARDEPLPVGAKAPPVEGVAAGRPALLLFYRGHW